MLPDVSQDLDVSELAQPIHIVDEQGVLLPAALEVEEAGDLRSDLGEIGTELGLRQQVAFVASPRWVADHPRTPAGDGDRPVTGALEPAQRGKPNEVSDMKGRRAGIDTQIKGGRSFAKARRQRVL